MIFTKLYNITEIDQNNLRNYHDFFFRNQFNFKGHS